MRAAFFEPPCPPSTVGTSRTMSFMSYSPAFASALSAHRFAFQLDAMHIVHQAVQDAVGDGGVPDLSVPPGLAGQQGGTELIPPIANLQEIVALGFGQRSHRPIVHDEQIDSVEQDQPFAVAAIGPRLSQVAKQFRGFEKERGVAIAAGLLRKRAS